MMGFGQRRTAPRSSRASLETESARRATRARDHLERQRAKERRRRERQQWKADRASGDRPRRRVLGPLGLVFGFAVGTASMPPLRDAWLAAQPEPGRVTVHGARILSPDEVVARAGLASLPDLSRGTLDQAVERLVDEPWIEQARVRRSLDGRLGIWISERRAIARWQRQPDGPGAFLDPNGETFAGDPELGGVIPLVLGGADQERLPAEAVGLLRGLVRHADWGLELDALRLHLPDGDSEGGFVLELGLGGPRVALGRAHLDQRLDRLAALVARHASDLEDVRFIDLRYADRAVLESESEPVSG